jgi:hypothetical protein
MYKKHIRGAANLQGNHSSEDVEVPSQIHRLINRLDLN